MDRSGKGIFTQEDRILKELYEQRGIQRWAEISKVMEGEFGLGGRNGKQCRERYHNHLQDCIRHEKWGQEEERVLVRQQGELGNRWAEISKFLPGRYSLLTPGQKTTSKTSSTPSSGGDSGRSTLPSASSSNAINSYRSAC